MGLFRTRNAIIEKLSTNQSREEIFEQHITQFPEDAAKYAYAIASVPHQQLREKYIRLNALLFLSLIGVAILAIAAEMPIDFEQTTLFIALKTSIPLVFCYFVYHFHGGIYRLLACWCLFDMTELIILSQFTSTAGLLKVVLLLFSSILALFIALKVFSNLKILGPKSNSKGQYLL